jgi:hypothetical protein
VKRLIYLTIYKNKDQTSNTHTTPATPHNSPRKPRQLPTSSRRAAVARTRKTRARPSAHSPPPRDVSAPKHKFDFGTSDQEDGPEDQVRISPPRPHFGMIFSKHFGLVCRWTG